MKLPTKLKAMMRAFDIRTYLKEHDKEPKQSGAEWSIDCPSCSAEGKSKKLWVTVEDKQDNRGLKKAGHWICYYCHDIHGEAAGTDVLGLIQWLEDCSLFEALEIISTYSVEGRKLGDLRTLVQDWLFGVEKIEAQWDESELPEMTLPEAFTPIKKKLPPYCKERGITLKRARRYGLGYVPGDTAGTFRNRLVVPVKSKDKTVFYVGRYMQRVPPEGIKKTLYPYGSHPNRVLFNYDRAKRCKRVVLVEDVWSAMAIGVRGEMGAMATFGTSFSQYQMEQLLKSRAEEVIIIWDRDLKNKKKHRGYEKALALAPRLAEFWKVRVVKLPDDRDPDEIPRRELERLIERSPVLDNTTAWREIARERLA